MPLCIYCLENSFDLEKGSKEHVILSSLGGRKCSRNICCLGCNRRLGNEIDEPFSKEYAFLSTMFDITKDGQKKEPPTHRAAVEHDGLAYDIKPGGIFNLSKPLVSQKDQPDGNPSISITAGSKEQLVILLKEVLKKYKKTSDDFPSLEATSIKFYLPVQHREITPGGSRNFRAVAKMLLTYLGTLVKPERLRSKTFYDVVAFIKGSNNKFSGINIGSCVKIPDSPKISDINHRAFIFASSKNNLVVGVLELFGNIKYTIELTSIWDGPDISKVYVIDPISTNSEEHNLESDLLSVFEGYENYKPDINSFLAGFDNVTRLFQERQSNQHIGSLTRAAVERHIIGKGDIITKEMIDNLVNEATLEFVKFLCRIDTKDIIDLKGEN